jgi:hypothetical protein
MSQCATKCGDRTYSLIGTVCTCGNKITEPQTGSGSPSVDNPTTLPTQNRILEELAGLLNVGADYGFKQAPNKVLVQPSKQTIGVNMDIKKIAVYAVIAFAAFYLYKKYAA